LALLRRLPRIKSSQKKRKRLIFLATSIAAIIKVTNAIAMIASLTIVIKTIDDTIVLVPTIRTQRAAVYLHKKVHIDIDPNAKPVHSRPYPVP
jgi:hypothetical protein